VDAWVFDGEVSFKVGKGSAEVLSINEGIEPAIATSIDPDKVGRLELSPGETMSGVSLRVRRAGKRLGRSVDVWYGDEAVYFNVG
jgi:hypothetical protein